MFSYNEINYTADDECVDGLMKTVRCDFQKKLFFIST